MDRYKACLVAKGFLQTHGVNYFETFSHIANLNSICILFSHIANLNWPIFQLDVKNVFLYVNLHEVNMEQNLGYAAQWKNVVYKLKKSDLWT